MLNEYLLLFFLLNFSLHVGDLNVSNDIQIELIMRKIMFMEKVLEIYIRYADRNNCFEMC